MCLVRTCVRVYKIYTLCEKKTKQIFKMRSHRAHPQYCNTGNIKTRTSTAVKNWIWVSSSCRNWIPEIAKRFPKSDTVLRTGFKNQIPGSKNRFGNRILFSLYHYCYDIFTQTFPSYFFSYTVPITFIIELELLIVVIDC